MMGLCFTYPLILTFNDIFDIAFDISPIYSYGYTSNTYSCLGQVALETISGEYLRCNISLALRQLDINSIFMVWPSVRLARNNNDLIHVKCGDFKITGLSFSNRGNESYRRCLERLNCKLDGKSWYGACISKD